MRVKRTRHRWLKSDSYDDGKILRLRCKVLGPNLARAANFVYGGINTIFGLTFLFMAIRGDTQDNPFWLIWFAHLLFYLITHELNFHLWLARMLFGKRLDFIMRDYYMKTGGWLRYTTWINHLLNFTTEIHPKAEDEAEEEERKGKRGGRYYRRTTNIVMINGEVEYVLASVYNAPKKVNAIMIRLHEMKALIDQQKIQI